MKHTRKITALLMCAVMTFTPVITPVYAEDTADGSEIVYKEETSGGLNITKLPDKLYYHIGEELDLTGGEASGSGSYEGLEWEVFPSELISLHVNDSEFDNTKPGTYTIYVSEGISGNFTTVASFEVVVLKDGEEAPDDAPLRKAPSRFFHIKQLPDKLSYQIGEELDLTGGVGYGDWTDVYAEPYIAPLSDFRVNASEFDSSTPGYYPIYVSFTQDGRSVSDGFVVTVEDPAEETTLPTMGEPSEGIYFKITKLPDKLHYQIGEELDLTGGMTYASGSFDPGCGSPMYWDNFYQPMTYYTVDASEFDNTKPGTYRIYLTCRGQLKSETVSFEVTVEGNPGETVPPTTLPPTTDPTAQTMIFCVHRPDRAYYKIGDELDLTGGYAWLINVDTYADVTDKISLTDRQYTIDASDFDSSKSGEYTIRVYYGIYQQEYTVYVLNADGTMPDGLPAPTGTDNPYNTDNSPEPTQALERFYKNDINGDGAADIMDVIILNKHLLGIYQLTDLQRTFADVNGDGVIDAADSIALLKKALGVTEQDDPVEPVEPTEATTPEPTTESVDPTDNCDIDPEETMQPTTDFDSGAVTPVKISEHFYGARVERSTSSEMDPSINVVTNAYNSLIGLYGPGFYENNHLIIIGQTETSGSYRLTVKDVTVDEDGIYTVHVERYKPVVCTCDLARWYLYVATDKGVTDADHVKVEFDDVIEETSAIM